MSLLFQKLLKVNRVFSHNKRWFLTTSTRFSKDEDGIIHFPDNPTIHIQEYEKPKDETIDTQRARLLYQSRKRAILENDLLLSNFAAKYLKNFTKEQLDTYDNLINRARNDWDIFYWITNKEPTPKEFQSDVLEMIKDFIKNNRNRGGIRQPDLQ